MQLTLNKLYAIFLKTVDFLRGHTVLHTNSAHVDKNVIVSVKQSFVVAGIRHRIDVGILLAYRIGKYDASLRIFVLVFFHHIYSINFFLESLNIVNPIKNDSIPTP